MKRGDFMRHLGLAIFSVFALVVMSAVCSAERIDEGDADFCFVDARDSTGYYVDMNSVSIKGPADATARVKMVKATSNRMYIYTINFNRQKRTYQIISSVAAAYDTKERVGGSGKSLKPLPYEKGSPMETVADYIYSPKP